jgi:hypothetical protein
VNQEEIQTVERRIAARVRQLKKWVFDIVFNEAMSTQMIAPKTMQEASSDIDRELRKSAMQVEYDLLM